MLPAGQEVGVDGKGDWLHFSPEQGQGPAVELFQGSPVDKFSFDQPVGGELAVGQMARRHQPVQFGLQPIGWESVTAQDVQQGHRAGLGQPPLQDATAPLLGGDRRVLWPDQPKGSRIFRYQLGRYPTASRAASAGNEEFHDPALSGQLANPGGWVYRGPL